MSLRFASGLALGQSDAHDIGMGIQGALVADGVSKGQVRTTLFAHEQRILGKGVLAQLFSTISRGDPARPAVLLVPVWL